MLAMFDPQAHILARRAIGFEFVSYHDARRFCRSLEKLAHEAPRSCSISPALDENVEDEAILIDGAPQPMLFAADRDDDLVQMPFVATSGSETPNAVGEFPAEFLRPAANRFMADVNTPSGEHFLDHTQAERKSKIEPYRIANHLGGEAMATVERITGFIHGPISQPNRPKFVNLTMPINALYLRSCFLKAIARNTMDNNDPEPAAASAAAPQKPAETLGKKLLYALGGFLLTTGGGTLIGHYFQERSWNNEKTVTKRQDDADRAFEVEQKVSEFIETRWSAAFHILDSLKSNKSEEELKTVKENFASTEKNWQLNFATIAGRIAYHIDWPFRMATDDRREGIQRMDCLTYTLGDLAKSSNIDPRSASHLIQVIDR